MANNQFINLEELSKTTQALLSKINEQSNLKVNKANVSAEYSKGTKIGNIEGTDFYAPEIDTSNFITQDDLTDVAYTGSYNDLRNKPTLATVATSGNYNDLSNKPTIPNVPAWALESTKPTYTASEVGAASTSDLNNYVKKEETSSFGNSTSISTTLSRNISIINIKANANQGYNANIKIQSGSHELGYSAIDIDASRITINGIVTPTSDRMAANKKYVDDSIVTAIGNINQFEVAIVTDLPTINIDAHTIYFKSNSSSGNNVYDEYMYINNNWELIGSTQIDLTPYARSADLATVATSGDYDDLTDAPVAEIDTNVETMLDSFDLDYTSNTSSPNIWQGGSY